MNNDSKYSPRTVAVAAWLGQQITGVPSPDTITAFVENMKKELARFEGGAGGVTVVIATDFDVADIMIDAAGKELGISEINFPMPMTVTVDYAKQTATYEMNVRCAIQKGVISHP